MISRLGISAAMAVAGLVVIGCDRSGDAAENGNGTPIKRAAVKSGSEGSLGTARPGTTNVPAQPPAPGFTPKVSGPGWEALETSHNFGEGWAAPGSLIKKTFYFTNVGDETLRILEAKPTCGCTVADNYTREVPPGGRGQISLTLTLQRQKGFITKTIPVKTNDPRHPVVEFDMRGNVKELCTTIPKEGATFTQVREDQRLYREVVIRSNVDYPLTLRLRPISADSFFAVAFDETVLGREWKLTVAAEPPIPEGQQKTTLYFDTNSPDVRVYELAAYCYRKPRVQVVPPKIVVNRVNPKPTKRNILIINNGQTPVEIVSIMTSDPQLNPTLLTRLAGKRYTIEVTLPAGYRPPPDGELIEIATTDWEKGLIQIWVQRFLRDPPTRPAYKSQNMVPGRM